MTDERRVLLVLWGAMVVSCVLFLFLIGMIPPGSGDPALFGILAVVGLVNIAASFPVKSRLSERRVPGARQQALLIALALCESAALLGVVSHVVTGHARSGWLIGAGLLGEILYHPRQE